MEYIGEHLLPGELGRSFTLLAFVFAGLAAIAFALGRNKVDSHWNALGKLAFGIHGLSVFSLIACIFYILTHHYFEYDYAWKHSNLDLPMRYILSAFWEGQEGSFLLWTFWHAILGFILVFFGPKSWKAPVLAIVSMVQLFLVSMVLGIYPFDIKIGSSPFVLIRDLPENIGLPWTGLEDYLVRIPAFMDGNGLNPLLQNYWMTIHPPITFLGFASTLIPFAFAIAALWTKRYTEWLKPVLPWTYFSVMILGTGILMGGAWAYEALSFGGFWAWDPVENSSLVPWLTMVGAAHLVILHKNKGGTLKSAMILSILSFLLILYSTFLTRSGILGDTSVHAFVDLGLSGQLLIYLFFFIGLALFLFFLRYKHLPKTIKEDDFWSREFWMFIASLVLLASAFQISFTTSIPVWNALFGPEGFIPLMDSNMAPPLDAIEHYNSFQIPFALIIALLLATGQFLRYGKTEPKRFLKSLTLSSIISLVVAVLLEWQLNFMSDNPWLLLLLYVSLFAVIANADYWLRKMRTKFGWAGASIAHMGFGLVLLGALISTGKQEIISENQTFIAKDFPQNENLLMELDDTLQLGSYLVSWRGERIEGNYRYYDVEYMSSNKQGEIKTDFILSPSILVNDRMGNSPEPDTKHYLEKDIYTHVTYAPLEEEYVTPDGFSKEAQAEMQLGDTAILAQSFVILDSINHTIVDGENGQIQEIIVEALLTIVHLDGRTYKARPQYIMRGQEVFYEDFILDEPGLKFQFNEIKPEENKMVIKSWRRAVDEKPFIVLKAIVFPMINLLWLGSVLMAFGTGMAVYNRIKIQRAMPNE